MKRAVQRFLPSRNQIQNSTSSIKKSLKFDGMNLIEDFYIELNDPHKIWAPGETITGTTTLALKRNMTNINISLTLVGYIKLKPGNSTSTARSKPTILFKHTAVIYGYDPNELPDEDGGEPIIGLSSGEHRFPFSMKLPRKNIYTSITFEKGSIAYLLSASINNNQQTHSPSLNSSPASLHSASSTASSLNVFPYSKNSIHHCEKNIQIVVPINVAKIPKPQTKVASLRLSDKKLRKTLSSTSTVNSNYTQSTNNSDHSTSSNENTIQSIAQAANSSPIKLAVDIPQSGFLRGELIPIKIKVAHYKPIQTSNGIIVTLIRVCRVDSGSETPIQSFRKDLCQTITPLYIDPESLTSEVSTSLKVPVDAFPTIIGSNLVSFQYYIEVLANVSSKNVISSNTSNSNNGGNTKFSHSVMFDLDSTRERDLNKHAENGGFINVDKLKRAKKLLGLNTEIIVGTERVVKTKHSKVPVQNGNTDSPSYAVESDSSMLEALSQTSISPLSIDGNPHSNTGEANADSTSNDANIAIGQEICNSGLENLSDKEALRLKEELLLPSDPNYADVPAPSYFPNSTDENASAPPLPSANFEPSSSSPSSSSPTAPPIPTSPIVSIPYNGTQSERTFTIRSEDKQELERRRLQQLESDPPEFDYVPEYIPNTIPSSSSSSSSAQLDMGRAQQQPPPRLTNSMSPTSSIPSALSVSSIPSRPTLNSNSNELETLTG
jgi:hypothetical protein